MSPRHEHDWKQVILLSVWGCLLVMSNLYYQRLISDEQRRVGEQLEAGSVQLAVANNQLVKSFRAGAATSQAKINALAETMQECLITRDAESKHEARNGPPLCLGHIEEVQFRFKQSLRAHQMCPLNASDFIGGSGNTGRRILESQALSDHSRYKYMPDDKVKLIDEFRTFLLRLLNTLGQDTPKVYRDTVVAMIHEATEEAMREQRNKEAEDAQWAREVGESWNDAGSVILSPDAQRQHQRLMELRREHQRSKKRKRGNIWREDELEHNEDVVPQDISAQAHPIPKGLIRAYYILYRYQQVIRRVTEVRSVLEPLIWHVMKRNDTMLYNYI